MKCLYYPIINGHGLDTVWPTSGGIMPPDNELLSLLQSDFIAAIELAIIWEDGTEMGTKEGTMIPLHRELLKCDPLYSCDDGYVYRPSIYPPVNINSTIYTEMVDSGVKVTIGDMTSNDYE